MKSFSLIVLFSFCMRVLFLVSQAVKYLIIPQPVSLEKRSGQFQLSASTGIVASDNSDEIRESYFHVFRGNPTVNWFSFACPGFKRRYVFRNIFFN